MKEIIVADYGHFCLSGDWKTHYQKLADNGATGVRVFGQIAWLEGRGTLSPFDTVKSIDRINQFEFLPPRRSHYVERDGKVCWHKDNWSTLYLPVYDMEVIRPEYLEKAQEYIEFLYSIGMEVKWELEDWCSLKHSQPDKYRHAYYVSPQAYSATTTPGGLYGEKMIPFMLNYWRPILALKPNEVSVMNEFGYVADASRSPEELKQMALDWYGAMNSVIKIRGIKTFGSVTDSQSPYHKEISAICDHYWIHGCGNKSTYEDNRAMLLRAGIDSESNPGHFILSGDGFQDGTGLPDFRGRRGISLIEVPELCDLTKDRGYGGVEALIRLYGGHAVGDYTEFQDKHRGYDIVREFAKRLNNWTEPIVPPKPEYVDVNICGLSLKLAGTWCQIIVENRYVKGTEPTTICDVCLPPEPPEPVKRSIWHWLFGKNSLWANFWRWIGGKK